MEKDFYTEIELSERISVSLSTLRRWRLENRGPKFRKLGALVRYGADDLKLWTQAQPSGGASELERFPPASTNGRGSARFRRRA